jgi:hypothetical protein
MRKAVVSDNKAPFPVFGVHKNGASVLSIIEGGASYANIRADVANRSSSYNNVFAQFTIVHGAEMDISGKSDKSVYQYEKDLPKGEVITLRVIPTTGGYSGMAKTYREYLLRANGELKSGGVSAGVPVVVEIITAVNKIQHRLGFPFDLPLKLTSYKEAADMVNQLAHLGWKNVNVKLLGWFNKSVEHSVPSKIKLISELGSKKDFLALQKTARDNDYNLYADADFLFMRDNTIFDTFGIFRDGVRYVSRERAQLYPYSFVWFGQRENFGKLSYVARTPYMVNTIASFRKKANAIGIKNFSLRSAGSKLAADYTEKRPLSREESLKQQAQALISMHQKDGVMISAGFDYAIPGANFVIDMPLTDQGFAITDASVPFYQIALHGIVPYTGKAINLAEDYTKNLLKTIEAGAGLYFSFMKDESATLQETKFRQFYANEFDKWIDDADKLYKQFAKDFSGLYNLPIDGHQIIAPDVTITTYSDGTKVYVNASESDYLYDGLTINANNYKVIRK